MTEKSILEQALLQVQNLEEAVKQNAKGILASTMKQELNDLLKESLEEEEEVAEQPNPEEEGDDMSDDTTNPASDNVAGADGDSAENDTDLDNEPNTDVDSLDSDVEGESGVGEPTLNLPPADESSDDEDVMDMTGASDEEVLKVFKAMKPEDGIVVKKEGDEIEFGDGDNEYIIKLDNEDESTPEFEPEAEGEFNSDELEETDEEGAEEEADEETLYEIELDEEEEEEVKEEEEEETHEVEATEAARTKSNPHGNKGGAERAGLPSKKTYKAGSGVQESINEEVESLKKQNAEYKKALVLFKDKLNEVAVFNANLAYATRLFTEHSTTKQEKLNILKRFDSVSSLNESKNLFNTIKTELGTKTTVTESVVDKISNTPSTSSSQEVLAEAKAYENPQFKRMKDLMSKMKY